MEKAGDGLAQLARQSLKLGSQFSVKVLKHGFIPPSSGTTMCMPIAISRWWVSRTLGAKRSARYQADHLRIDLVDARARCLGLDDVMEGGNTTQRRNLRRDPF